MSTYASLNTSFSLRFTNSFSSTSFSFLYPYQLNQYPNTPIPTNFTILRRSITSRTTRTYAHAMSNSAPEQATKVAIYTLSGDRGLRRCVRWRVMILTTTGKRIALLTTRTLKDGQHTGEISLATTDETDSSESVEHYWLADRLHRGAPAVFELALGRPADIMFFIDSMRHDASRHLWVSSDSELDDAYWIKTSLGRTQYLFEWNLDDLERVDSFYDEMVAYRKAKLDAKGKSLFGSARKSVMDLREKARHGR
ncbi:hypothetical protein BJ166DRAFT_624600 [Pestalotiopsis sp. NC0098]|nr:hypothetical protein BJ166DRAFT_624600 [Pestalotiopsis sp. NC0098]